MENNFAEAIKNCLNGRKVTVWGTGPNSENLVGKVFKYCDIDFFLSRDAKDGDTFLGKPVYPSPSPEGGCLITPTSHFIVILAGDIYPEIREQLCKTGLGNMLTFSIGGSLMNMIAYLMTEKYTACCLGDILIVVPLTLPELCIHVQLEDLVQ